MTSQTARFLPYATSPGRLAVQLLSDVAVVVWTAGWALVGVAVHDAISVIADTGAQVESGAHGLADNLASASYGMQLIPVLGNAVSKPLKLTSAAALDIAEAGHSLDTTASWLAILLALAVIALPILVAVVPWLFLRLRFFQHKWTVTTLAATPAGKQLLALRALTLRSPSKLAAVSADPVGGWRREDPDTIRDLAALELRSCGIALRGH
ncbi:hypothetical protein [Mycobacterium lepromatosis]|uniref:Transmembrane protein n=1 Tax=Mycobacterium lepromatosis TaxID=480418 RepID=A0A0F4EP23_9MYCO|nr:hypothetical protein [Mycobacterium lepromatosis]KJX74726.1 hypothetical protein MLPM_2228 [Mycobacterium lepromatosis]UKN42761.1 transmembrane protein [Mycobacterium lepromatosis]